MNTAEMVSDISKHIDISVANSKSILNFILGRIVSEVKKGNCVKFSGFGAFYKVERKERKGRNPQTGEPVVIPAAIVPKFKPGKAFKSAAKSTSGTADTVESLRSAPKKSAKKSSRKKKK